MDEKTVRLSNIARGLALIASDPALGYRGAAVKSVLDLVSVAVLMGDEADKALAELAAQVEQMVAEDREPTKDEWYSLRDRSKAAHDFLNPPPPEPEAPAPENDNADT